MPHSFSPRHISFSCPGNTSHSPRFTYSSSQGNVATPQIYSPFLEANFLFPHQGEVFTPQPKANLLSPPKETWLLA